MKKPPETISKSVFPPEKTNIRLLSESEKTDIYLSEEIIFNAPKQLIKR